MNQLDRIRGILSRITYKPGWKIEAMRHEYHEPSAHQFGDWNRVYLRVSVSVKDSDTGHAVMLNRFTSLMDIDLEHIDDEQVIRYFIHRAIWQMEEHEYHEWFKVDGVHVFDPHPELKEKA